MAASLTAYDAVLKRDYADMLFRLALGLAARDVFRARRIEQWRKTGVGSSVGLSGGWLGALA